MTVVLSKFGLSDMLRCSGGLRAAMTESRTLESAARAATDYLYGQFVTESGTPACALARFYTTQPVRSLPNDLQRFARSLLPPGVTSFGTDMRCLTLMATRGEERAWNDRRRSHGHRAIPLVSAQMVERAPMVAGLIRGFGLDIATAIRPTREVAEDLAGKSYGVFHVAQAQGSALIPAQDFVSRYGIESVLGFGGSLPTGDLFAILLFSKSPIEAAVADRFRTLALDVKSRLFLFREQEIFD